MAYTAGNLHLRAGAPGDLTYTYDAGSDTLATVATAGYFNNSDDNLALVVDDLIWVQANDGNAWFRVSALSSGSVTLQFAGGNLPVGTPATGTSVKIAAAWAVGQYEIGTSVATATRYILPTPYAGAEVLVKKVGSGTQVMQIDAGGSGATGVTYDAIGNRKFTLKYETEMFHVIGTSASRWRIQALNLAASVAGSVSLTNPLGRFPGAT